MTPLGDKLSARIRADGPITLADYMAACLTDPIYGYYATREPFGRQGDFITAPEVSQMFGELVGAWCIAAWEAMRSAAPFVLAELGPGRGTMMADLLRAGRLRPRFIEAARVCLVETSPRLRDVQRLTLALAAGRLTWVDRIEDLPALPMILIANEFFDALPIRQFARAPKGWAERMVGLGEDGGLTFGWRPLEDRSAGLPEPPEYAGDHRPHEAPRRSQAEAPPGVHEPQVIEVSPARAGAMQAIAERLRRDGGAAVIFDYGYDGPAWGDTLQAVRHHHFVDPLALPGEADLTAHVDFAALAKAAQSAGAVPRARIGQGEFLYRLGLAERAAQLARGKGAPTQAAIAAAVERLAGPASMGNLFKVLAVSSPGVLLPLFDDYSRE